MLTESGCAKSTGGLATSKILAELSLTIANCVLPSRGYFGKSHPAKSFCHSALQLRVPGGTGYGKRKHQKCLFWKQLGRKLKSLIFSRSSESQAGGSSGDAVRLPTLPFPSEKRTERFRWALGIAGFPLHRLPLTFRFCPQKPLQTWKALFLTVSELLCPVFFMPTPHTKTFCCSVCSHRSKNQIPSRLGVFPLLFRHFPGPGKRMWPYGSGETQLNNNHSPTALPVHTQNTCPKPFTLYTKIKWRQN